jgi:mannose-1-phosphate guanylyltransferase
MTFMAKDFPIYYVIMAGGRGTRFWPRSRTRKPKQLLDIIGPRTMLEQTVDRILPLSDWDHIVVVTEVSQAEAIRKLLPRLKESHLLIEPLGKNTAPCIGLAALTISQWHPTASMAVLPADHFISNMEDFQKTLQTALEVSRQGDFLITLGIKPAVPETGYGYLEQGKKIMEQRGAAVWEVKAFHEKPDQGRAKAMLQSGTFFWNSGMFVWSVSAVLKKMSQWTPDLYRELMALEKVYQKPDWDQALRKAYERMENISIDYALMERADQVVMLQADFGWNDVGSWEAVYQLEGKDGEGNCFKGSVLALDSRGCLVDSPDKTVTLIGVKDLVIVTTPDAVLICPRSRSQDVKKIVELLEKKGWEELL